MPIAEWDGDNLRPCNDQPAERRRDGLGLGNAIWLDDRRDQQMEERRQPAYVSMPLADQRCDRKRPVRDQRGVAARLGEVAKRETGASKISQILVTACVDESDDDITTSSGSPFLGPA
jgi:hypothetical protein